MLEVEPEAHFARHLFPFLGIFPNALTGFAVEFRDAVFFDLLFVIKAKLFFDFNFYRQAMRIPASFAENKKSPHGFIAAKKIFIDAGQEVAGMRLAVRRRRTDRKSTRLNSSHQIISYALFCFKKKNKHLTYSNTKH